MYVQACRLYQGEGWPLPRHRLAMRQRTVDAWLVYRQEHDQESGAIMQKARLVKDGGEVIAELLHAVMVDVENGAMRVRGIERDPVTRKEYAMAWYCEVIDGRWQGSDARGPRPV